MLLYIVGCEKTYVNKTLIMLDNGRHQELYFPSTQASGWWQACSCAHLNLRINLRISTFLWFKIIKWQRRKVVIWRELIFYQPCTWQYLHPWQFFHPIRSPWEKREVQCLGCWRWTMREFCVWMWLQRISPPSPPIAGMNQWREVFRLPMLGFRDLKMSWYKRSQKPSLVAMSSNTHAGSLKSSKANRVIYP